METLIGIPNPDVRIGFLGSRGMLIVSEGINSNFTNGLLNLNIEDDQGVVKMKNDLKTQAKSLLLRMCGITSEQDLKEFNWQGAYQRLENLDMAAIMFFNFRAREFIVRQIVQASDRRVISTEDQELWHQLVETTTDLLVSVGVADNTDLPLYHTLRDFVGAWVKEDIKKKKFRDFDYE